MGQNGHADPRDIAFRPSEVSTFAVSVMEERRADPEGGLRTGIRDLDAIMLPLRPGEFVPVLGSTSNGKSALMNYIARHAAKRIDPESDHIVVKVTWEQSVEEDVISDLAFASGVSVTKIAQGQIDDPEWRAVMRAAVKRGVNPVWVVGHSMERAKTNRKHRPGLTMSDVALALEYICDNATDRKLQIDLVVLDYLQRIHRENIGHGEMREGYMHIVDRAKDAALAFGCPLLMGTQAGRQVLDRRWKLPMMSDSQESSNCEQSADKFLSVWLPKMTEPPGGTVQQWVVTENLLIVGLLKQKLGPAPRVIGLHLDAATNQFYGLEDVGQGRDRETETQGANPHWSG